MHTSLLGQTQGSVTQREIADHPEHAHFQSWPKAMPVLRPCGHPGMVEGAAHRLAGLHHEGEEQQQQDGQQVQYARKAACWPLLLPLGPRSPGRPPKPCLEHMTPAGGMHISQLHTSKDQQRLGHMITAGSHLYRSAQGAAGTACSAHNERGTPDTFRQSAARQERNMAFGRQHILGEGQQ